MQKARLHRGGTDKTDENNDCFYIYTLVPYEETDKTDETDETNVSYLYIHARATGGVTDESDETNVSSHSTTLYIRKGERT